MVASWSEINLLYLLYINLQERDKLRDVMNIILILIQYHASNNIFLWQSTIPHRLEFIRGPAEMQVECALVKQNYKKLNNNYLIK